MKHLIFFAILCLTSLTKDFISTQRQFINQIVDIYLQKQMGDAFNYREILADKLFDSLKREYPEMLFFVNVYKPVMGWDNYASKATIMYDRLHKKNDMRFNLIVAAV